MDGERKLTLISWLRRQNRPDVLRDGAGVLLPHVLRGGGGHRPGWFGCCVPHELHQRGQADAFASMSRKRRCVETGAGWPSARS